MPTHARRNDVRAAKDVSGQRRQRSRHRPPDASSTAARRIAICGCICGSRAAPARQGERKIARSAYAPKGLKRHRQTVKAEASQHHNAKEHREGRRNNDERTAGEEMRGKEGWGKREEVRRRCEDTGPFNKLAAGPIRGPFAEAVWRRTLGSHGPALQCRPGDDGASTRGLNQALRIFETCIHRFSLSGPLYLASASRQGCHARLQIGSRC